MPTIATNAAVTPVTSTSNTATEKTLTTTITAATSSQSLKDLITFTAVQALPSGIFGLPPTNVKTNINSTQEGGQSSAPIAKKRPASNISPESSKVSLAKKLCFN